MDTQQTGYDCIQYMREHRVGVASFIPLQGLKTKEVNERLRSLSANCKLCLDVMSFAPEYKAAVMYAVENTVVCETYDDAREVRVCVHRSQVKFLAPPHNRRTRRLCNGEEWFVGRSVSWWVG